MVLFLLVTIVLLQIATLVGLVLAYRTLTGTSKLLVALSRPRERNVLDLIKGPGMEALRQRLARAKAEAATRNQVSA